METKQPSGRKFLSVLLALVMLLSMLPVSALAVEEGKFALFAVSENGAIIDPCYVTYSAGQTIKDALKGSNHTFTGIDDGIITAIDGKEGNFTLFSDGGNYKLDKSAAEITGLWFTTNASQQYSDHLLESVKAMAKFSAATNGVKDYADAKTAYDAAAKGFYAANDTSAEKLAGDLNGAMQRYEAYIGGAAVPVTLNVTLDSTAVTPQHVKFTGEFGNVVEADNTKTISVVPGKYTYEITYETFRHARGTVDVNGPDITLDAQLPTGQWIKDIQLGITSNWQPQDKMVQKDASASGATYQIPDYADGKLYACVEPNTGTDINDIELYATAPGNTSKRGWKSTTSVTSNAYKANSLEGSVFQYEARSQSNPGMYQTYTVKLVRTPSLSDLKVVGGGVQLPLEFAPGNYIYRLTTIGETVEVTPTALVPETTITVIPSNGQPGIAVDSGKSTTLRLDDCDVQPDGTYGFAVKVESPDNESVMYLVRVTQTASADVTINHNGTSVEVFTKDGFPVTPKTPGAGQSVFALVPGETYECVSTKDTFYHTSVTFQATAGLSFDAPAPIREDWLSKLQIKAGGSTTAPEYPVSPGFAPQTHRYTATADSSSTFFVVVPTAKEGISMEAVFRHHPGVAAPGKQERIALTSGKTRNLTNLLAVGGIGNDVTLKLSKEQTEAGKPYNEKVTFYQDYPIHVNRQIILNTMAVADDQGNKLNLTQKNAPEKERFDKLVTDYTVKLGQLVPTLQINTAILGTSSSDVDFTLKAVCGNWSKEIVYSADLKPNAEQTLLVPLDSAKDKETVQITVSHKEQDSVPTTYTIEVEKMPAIKTTITADPADATIYLVDNSLKARILPAADGSYMLNTGISYTCTVTRKGYVGKAVDFTAGADSANQTIKLDKAPASTLTDISKPGDWHQFRADDNNNGVVNYKTPIKAEDSVLVWANKIGQGFSGGATGSPIIAGGYLYTYAGKNIFKVDKETGEVVASSTMVAPSSFGINSPTYAEGMIFIGLSNGCVQAFNADTLESLWVYKDTLKGQPNCPIAYADGYVYTGFWNSETRQANFVCLSVTDEDPSQTNEAKLPTWAHTDKGFYWAGAYVNKDFLLIPTDDGERGYTTGHGDLLSLDPKTGRLIERLTMPGVGDLRSSVCYDEATNAYYFTSKGGDFYQVKVNADGTFVKDSLRRLHLDNDANNPAVPPMSTSTPVIYKGRAYIGVSGASQFGAYSGHNMTVIDLNSFSVAYKVPTQGYPQVSGLLTTAYEDTGYVYVYFIDNMTPGKIRVIRDQAGRTTPDPEYLTKETYTSGGKEITVDAGYVLFTPSGKQAQYAICSPIADTEGNLYFKNDSAYMMRLSSVITKLEVTQQPQKTTYEKGQTFDGKGLAVTAHYANGLTKDITSYLSFTTDPLTEKDTEITISYDMNKLLHHKDQPDAQNPGHWAMYHDENGAAGKPVDIPTASVSIQVNTDHTWDEGKVQSPSTCTEHGKILHTCTVCGQTKLEELPLAPHTLTHVAAKAPTCTQDGNKEHYHCSHCQKNFADAEGKQELADVVEAAKGHALTHVDAKAPTCTQDGTKEHYHCSLCGKNFSDPEGKQELASVVDPAKGHGKTEVRNSKEATCTEEGYTGDTYCTICGEKVSEGKVIPALGHSKTEIRNAKEATCTEEGYTGDTYCTICGEKLSEGKVIPALGHGETEIRNAKKATTTEAGYTGDTYCTVCGEKIAEGKVIPKMDAPKPATPTTGDSTPIVPLISVTLLSLTAAAVLYLLRKKRHTA